jgi:hypothetical protein
MPRIAEETIDDREEATIDEFIAFLEVTSRKRHPTGPIPRFNQGRASGCVHASFVVPEGLAPELQVGLFAKPATYAAWIRFANASSDTDRDADVRGMSIKVLDVPGKNLTAGATSQDFILNSHPVMVVPNTAEFLKLLRAMDAGGLEMAGYFLGHPQAAVIGAQARQHPSSHLDIPYWSTTPYLLGAGRAVKYIVRPTSATRSQLPSPLTDRYLRDALAERLSRADASFEFCLQFQTDAAKMPIEDASVEWKEDGSPYLPVARIDIARQDITLADTVSRCEAVVFNPWFSLVDHQPLGNMNRARRRIYQAMAAFRQAHGTLTP